MCYLITEMVRSTWSSKWTNESLCVVMSPSLSSPVTISSPPLPLERPNTSVGNSSLCLCCCYFEFVLVVKERCSGTIPSHPSKPLTAPLLPSRFLRTCVISALTFKTAKTDLSSGLADHKKCHVYRWSEDFLLHSSVFFSVRKQALPIPAIPVQCSPNWDDRCSCIYHHVYI